MIVRDDEVRLRIVVGQDSNPVITCETGRIAILSHEESSDAL